jgi:aminopeptidase N
MLRRRMGDARFYEMLAEFRRRYELKSVTTEQFRALAARFLPPRSEDSDLSAFFDQFVYDTGIPALKLKWSVKGKGKAMRVEGAVTQTEVDKEFTVPVPVEIQLSRGKSVTRIVSTGAEPATFSVPVAAAPVKVVLDPRWSVLRR